MLRSENLVEKYICKFMLAQGWLRYRNHVGTFTPLSGGPPVSIGTAGDPDWTFRRCHVRGKVYICHVEAKREGVILKLHDEPKTKAQIHDNRQLERIAQLNFIGESAWWANSLAMHEREYWKVF